LAVEAAHAPLTSAPSPDVPRHLGERAKRSALHARALAGGGGGGCRAALRPAALQMRKDRTRGHSGKASPKKAPGSQELPSTAQQRENRMIIVRSIFIARPGQASKLAAQFKSAAAAAKMPKYRVLTDLTGEFNRVILEYEVETIAGFDAQMKEYATSDTLRAALKGYTDLYLTGTRELLQTA
jgi:hypothetical protein